MGFLRCLRGSPHSALAWSTMFTCPVSSVWTEHSAYIRAAGGSNPSRGTILRRYHQWRWIRLLSETRGVRTSGGAPYFMPHNASTYRNHGCRCLTCRNANRVYGCRQRHRRAALRRNCTHREWRFHSFDIRFGSREICCACNATRKAPDQSRWNYTIRKRLCASTF